MGGAENKGAWAWQPGLSLFLNQRVTKQRSSWCPKALRGEDPVPHPWSPPWAFPALTWESGSQKSPGSQPLSWLLQWHLRKKSSLLMSGNACDLTFRPHCYHKLAWYPLGMLLLDINNLRTSPRPGHTRYPSPPILLPKWLLHPHQLQLYPGSRLLPEMMELPLIFDITQARVNLCFFRPSAKSPTPPKSKSYQFLWNSLSYWDIPGSPQYVFFLMTTSNTPISLNTCAPDGNFQYQAECLWRAKHCLKSLVPFCLPTTAHFLVENPWVSWAMQAISIPKKLLSSVGGVVIHLHQVGPPTPPVRHPKSVRRFVLSTYRLSSGLTFTEQSFALLFLNYTPRTSWDAETWGPLCPLKAWVHR